MCNRLLDAHLLLCIPKKNKQIMHDFKTFNAKLIISIFISFYLMFVCLLFFVASLYILNTNYFAQSLRTYTYIQALIGREWVDNFFFFKTMVKILGA